MDISKYQAFAKAQLGDFKNTELLVTAFTHRSYLNEHRKTATEHN
ncbi:ribonuclease III, partial [Candidatus Saccharibacteria bacterium]|nr:ribonuclease III [Candidatus Saccharibacteria bacterium]